MPDLCSMKGYILNFPYKKKTNVVVECVSGSSYKNLLSITSTDEKKIFVHKYYRQLVIHEDDTLSSSAFQFIANMPNISLIIEFQVEGYYDIVFFFLLHKV